MQGADKPNALSGLFDGLTGLPRVAVAVSGGSDSMALYTMLKDHPVATVDHGLRVESHLEAEKVAKWTGATILKWQGEKPQTGLQEAARIARYRLLVSHAKSIGADAIVTAHTLDDQAETLMMRLCRGSSPYGMAGMQATGDFEGFPLLRPLLWQTKANLREFLGEKPFIEDPSNQNEAFSRVRMRGLMPLLEKEGLTADRLGRFGARQNLINEALDFYADDLILKARNQGDLYEKTPFSVVLPFLSFSLLPLPPTLFPFLFLQRLFSSPWP